MFEESLQNILKSNNRFTLHSMALNSTMFSQAVRELDNPNSTPEKVLKSMVDLPSFSTYDKEDDKNSHTEVFIRFIKYIVKWVPDDCMDEIWECIVWKTLAYSRHILPHDVTIRILSQEDGFEIMEWIEYALCPKKMLCPNPYIRLSLFHVIWLCNGHQYLKKMSRYNLCCSFIHTICDVKPHRIYPIGNVDDVVFSAQLMEYIFVTLDAEKDLQQCVSEDLSKQIQDRVMQSQDTSQWIITTALEFAANCIQIIGVLANIAIHNPNPDLQYELECCCTVIKKRIGRLVKCYNGIPGGKCWMQFLYVFTNPQFSHFVVETVRDLSAAIVYYKRDDRQKDVMRRFDFIANDLDVCLDPDSNYVFPSLLLSRQIHESQQQIKQNSLLLRRINHLILESEDETSGDESDVPFVE